MRMNLEISESQMASYKKLQERMGASTMKELVHNALSMLEWAADETAEGNEIAAVNESESIYRVLVTLPLRYVAEHEAKVPALTD